MSLLLSSLLCSSLQTTQTLVLQLRHRRDYLPSLVRSVAGTCLTPQPTHRADPVTG
jgi:hypothetical protein